MSSKVPEMSKYFSIIIDEPFDIKEHKEYTPFTPQDWSNILNAMYPFYALCLHDSDIDESTGYLKTKHIHIVIFRGTRCRLLTLINELHKWTNYPTNCISVRIPQCWNKSIRYLIHLDNPEKAPYTPLEIMTNNQVEVDKAFTQLVDFVSYDTIEKIVYDNVLLPNIIRAMGIDTYNKYWRVVKAILDEPTFRILQENKRETLLKQRAERVKEEKEIMEVLNNE